MPSCLRYVRKELEELSPSEDTGLARAAMRIVESCLDDFVPGVTVAGGRQSIRMYDRLPSCVDHLSMMMRR